MPTSTEDKPRVSVIIPTLNAGAPLYTLLRKLKSQTLPPVEVIVIDSESSDGTPLAAEAEGARVLSVQRKHFDHGGTRNRAAESAVGDILLFMTQDAIPYNDCLIEALVDGLQESDGVGEDGQPVMAYARQLPRRDATLMEKLAREHNYPDVSHARTMADVEKLGIKAFFCSNVCAAVRKDVFFRMGKFQEPVMFNEDLFMAAKCILNGLKVVYRAEAKVIHSHNYSIWQQFTRFFDNGVSMSMNRWMTMYSAVGGAGSKLVKQQAKGLVLNGGWYWVPKLVLESAAKLAGYKLGLHYRRLPKFIVRRISMHPLIWQHINKQSEERSVSL